MRLSVTFICLLLLTACSHRPHQRVKPCSQVTDSAVLLIPEGEQPPSGWPAVLLLHDHGARFVKGWRKVIGSDPEPYYHGMSIGDTLAAHGYVVYCADALYWGSRRSSLTQRQFSDSLGGAGEWYAHVLLDDSRAVDYLCSLDYVDTTRIAVVGFSYGAYRAWNLASGDQRVKACIASHWMTTLAQNRYNDSWLCMVRKGIYPADKGEWEEGQSTNGKWREFYEVAAEIAPRPFLLQYGLHDKLFPVPAVDSCVHYIDSVYKESVNLKREKEGSFTVEAFDCGHEMTQKHLDGWLNFLQSVDTH